MSKQILPIIAGLIILCSLGWYIDSLAHKELTQAVKLTIAGVSLAVIVILGVTVSVFVLIAIERARIERNKRRLLERDSKVMIVTAGEREQVYIREQDTQATWRPLHLNPLQYQNGEQQEPSNVELALYHLWHSRPQVTNDTPLLLEAGQNIPELLPILDKAQRVLIIGASDAGKTNLLQWVVSRRIGAVIVIDPHASPNKWPKQSRVVGSGSNHPEIETVLDNLIELMVTRYKEIGQGLVREGEHPKLTIVIDEWMGIAYQCKNATEVMVRLLTESRKAAMSVIIGSHSERVKSLGLDGKGDLRDGFLLVRLWLENGERKATYDYGRGERPCLLPGKYEPPQDDQNIIEIEAITEVKPTGQEQMILDMAQAGESHAKICEAVWGYKSSKLYPQIDAILEKFGRVHRAQGQNNA